MPRGQLGFTLVEMLVALTIFAVLAGAGVSLLRSSVDTQAATADALSDLGTATRLKLLLGNDLTQAIPRPLASAPTGFRGTGNAITFVRAANPASGLNPGEELQAVRWSVEGSRLVRATLDGEGRLAGPAAILADEVNAVTLRYRQADGAWKASWDGADPAPGSLPRAVEMTIERSDEPAVTLVVALPEGAAPVPEGQS